MTDTAMQVAVEKIKDLQEEWAWGSLRSLALIRILTDYGTALVEEKERKLVLLDGWRYRTEQAEAALAEAQTLLTAWSDWADQLKRVLDAAPEVKDGE